MGTTGGCALAFPEVVRLRYARSGWQWLGEVGAFHPSGASTAPQTKTCLFPNEQETRSWGPLSVGTPGHGATMIVRIERIMLRNERKGEVIGFRNCRRAH